MQRVAITGPGDTAQRQGDTAGTIVVARDELLQFGDGTLSGVLGRLPGLSVADGEIRMRGLGAGYTQVRVNGDPAPPGFSLDTLAPELVERIEIMRTTSAEYSAQAMAGSINIVLRKAVRGTRRDVKLGVARERNRWSPTATLQLADKHGDMAYVLAATLARTFYDSLPRVATDATAPNGTLLSRRRFDEDYHGRVDKASLAPRVTWTMANGDTLAWQSLIDIGRTATDGTSVETTLAGTPTRSPLSRFTASAEDDILRSDVNWSHRLGAARLTAKAGINSSRRRGDYRFTGSDLAGTPTMTRNVVSSARDDSAGSNGKLLMPLLPGHGVALGWDATYSRRRETRVQHDTAPADTVLDQDYTAGVTRLALFAQDEWDIGEHLQAYLGLRWEGLDSTTRGSTLAGVGTRASVWSPVLQALWKVPDRGQWRLAVARTYKAPLTRNLVPRRYTVNNDNSPGTPDIEGNPALRPELAWGVDGGWEAYFGGQGVVGVTGYARRISDVTVQRLFRDRDTWVSTLTNGGGATAHGIEFDAKVPLRSLLAAGPDLDLRVNASRNWSRVDAVPGPGNRLADQTPLTANLGADYRIGAAWSAGINYSYQGSSLSRRTPLLQAATGPVRTLDTYMAWNGGQHGKLRIGLVNLLRDARTDGQLYSGEDGATDRRTVTPTAATLRVQFDLPLGGPKR
ncbi:TonB-dependent receptor plug domain-containing protein [Pseudoduganella plicata]|uniref:Ligand-gated channel n=1 Tax=Pseudoduganella plicata TaxID=321984 RepID=A0A4P7BL97_9BURK|nr:TonB-dependent receptor [Pseudoduganella plicata]QBQ38495.1 TonB-dependent receptor [Pseudoduganella plicata]GGY82494.1 ligand-gated channel [Pseudoduganella plicata]